MKILSNKNYNALIDLKSELCKERNKLINESNQNIKIIQDLSKELITKNNKLKQKEAEFHELKQEFRVYEADLKNEIVGLKKAKGGFKKEINKQKEKVEELEFKLKESMTDKYLVKKLPPAKVKSTFEMKIKDSSKTSRIASKLYKED